MVSSPVVVGGNREIPMYMGLTKSGERYYLEPSLTRHISNHADRWERDGYSVDLDRGEAAVYTVDLAMFHGVSKKQVTSVHALLGDYLLLDEPSLAYRSDKAVIEIGIAVSGDAQLVVEDTATGNVLWSTDLVPGSVMRISEDVELTEKGAKVTVLLKNAAGRQILAGNGAGS